MSRGETWADALTWDPMTVQIMAETMRDACTGNDGLAPLGGVTVRVADVSLADVSLVATSGSVLLLVGEVD